jgi:cytochrome P450
MPTELVTDDAEVRAILADPAFQVPPAPPVPITETGTLAWLRAHVARFCDGQVHDRRRELVERELAAIDPPGLRTAAAELTSTVLTGQELARAGRAPFDAMLLARQVPVAVLAGALGVTADLSAKVVGAVLASASGYPNPDLAGPDADDGVRFLATALGPADADLLANRIGLLEQACDATAALIGNALIAAFADVGSRIDTLTQTGPLPQTDTADEVIARTLTDDPPVRRTRRLSPDGTQVTVDISACPFGAGRRPCPGADQAKALAAGVLDAMLPVCELADQRLSYLPSPNLRMPEQLLVTVR